LSDEGDRDVVHTALRETHEEIGLLEDRVQVWGSLPPSPSTARKVGSMIYGDLLGVVAPEESRGEKSLASTNSSAKH